MKMCRRCFKRKPSEQFTPLRKNSKQRESQCRDCRNKARRELHKKNPVLLERHRERSRKRRAELNNERTCFSCKEHRPKSEFVPGGNKCVTCKNRQEYESWQRKQFVQYRKSLKRNRRRKCFECQEPINDSRKYCERCRKWQAENVKCLRHGINILDYNELWVLQDGRCLICQRTENLVIDHDHGCCPGMYSCGDCVRGLLCVRCNTGIGYFKDSSRLLASAQKYLTRE